nr:sensor histidine kinase [Neobacillus sp. Marseille-Q6967]
MKSIKRSFYLKNLVKLLIPMLIPLIILGSLANILIHLHIKEKINQENLNMLSQIRSNVEIIFNELDSINLTIVASALEFVDLQNMLQKEWFDPEDHKKLASLKNIIDSPSLAHPYIDSIYIYIENNRNRFLTTSTGGVVDLTSYEDTSWYQSYHRDKGNKEIWTENRTIYRSPFDTVEQKIDVITVYRNFTLANGNLGVIVLNVNTSYLKNYLNTLDKIKGQNILVIDHNSQVLFENYPVQLTASEIKSMVSSPKTMNSINIQNQRSIAFKLESEKYEWAFFSTIPKTALYKATYQLSIITLLLLFSSVIVGVIVAYYLTKKNFADIQSVLSILNKAEKGETLPHLPSKVNDIHSYIIHKIITNFMEQSYLKVLLSERKYKMQALELAVHQSQLNPHFLFNTLETINWKVISLTKRPNEINEMIDNLATILRYSLEAHNGLVFLMEEMKHTRSYIEIQKIRYKDKFDVIWDFDEELEKYYVLKLILQPLIENCLVHGKVESKKLTIKIKIKLTKSNLDMAVIDNGAGIETDKLSTIRSKLASNYTSTEHIGLYNTHKRLQLTFGDDFGAIIYSKSGWGTVVRIRIPIN